MLVCVAGPYSAPSEEQRAANLRAMNEAAAQVMRRGHRAMIGVNAALPILQAAGLPYSHPWMMELALALAGKCDAGLRIGRSPGADREMDLLTALGRPVYDSPDDLPAA
jgi:hypothetical protein